LSRFFATTLPFEEQLPKRRGEQVRQPRATAAAHSFHLRHDLAVHAVDQVSRVGGITITAIAVNSLMILFGSGSQRQASPQARR
jgi:hypothetical protein